MNTETFRQLEALVVFTGRDSDDLDTQTSVDRWIDTQSLTAIEAAFVRVAAVVLLLQHRSRA